MYISNLTLKNFRNHTYASFEFQKGLNILQGDNGVGKTNIIEAMYYLSVARSFRGVENKLLIQEDKDKSRIEASINEGRIVRDIQIDLIDDARQILVNKKPIKKLSELSKCVNVILFEPEDVFIFKGPPKDRRNFLDISLSKKSGVYLDYISRYEKVLKQRNSVLKEDNPDMTLLNTCTEMLIKLSQPIIRYRELYIEEINKVLSKIVNSLNGKEEQIELVYAPFIKNDDKFIETAKKVFEKGLENDLKKKATSIGIHREDFMCKFKGNDIALSGSQGENRIVSIGLKLAPYFLIEDEDKKPIVALDDVMSELDATHRANLIKLLENFEQVFISATSLNIKGAKIYTLKKKI